MPLADFHEHFAGLCDRLRHTKRKGRIGQAYLFEGDDVELLGQFTTAWLQVCACKEPTPEGDACGVCRDCRQLAEGNYSERNDLVPESKSRLIVVDKMREFEHQLKLSTAHGRMKFGVIAEADCLNEQAQNAFLKTLEEPPPRTVLVLYSARPRRLLPTIRSRCQLVSLRTNRNRYPLAFEHGVFPILALLQPRAGATAALRASAQLQAVYAILQAEAEEQIEAERDEQWDAIAADDPRLRKKLEDQRKARVQAEYLRRRNSINDAIQTWFLQQSLRAAGIQDDAIPHPELLAAVPEELRTVPDYDGANAAVRHVAELIRCLDANVPEPLALEACCLEITRKG
jgi:hypothetical protein